MKLKISQWSGGMTAECPFACSFCTSCRVPICMFFLYKLQSAHLHVLSVQVAVGPSARPPGLFHPFLSSGSSLSLCGLRVFSVFGLQVFSVFGLQVFSVRFWPQGLLCFGSPCFIHRAPINAQMWVPYALELKRMH